MSQIRLFPVGLGALLSLGLVGFGCSSSSDSGTGGSAGTGTTATGGSTSGTGGSSSAGTGGSTTGTGGSTTGTGGSSGGADMPPVPQCLTEAKGAACTTLFPEGSSCYKTCGPDSVGYKLETCTPGMGPLGASGYVEGDCQYLLSKNYSCYKLPAPPAMPPACPAGAQASQLCTMDACAACGPSYLDTSSTMKTGYCVCNAMTGKWTCGSISSNSWPCSQTPPNSNPGCM